MCVLVFPIFPLVPSARYSRLSRIQELKTKGPYSSSGSSHAVNTAVEQGSKYVFVPVCFTSYLTTLSVQCTLSPLQCWVHTSHGVTTRAARYKPRLTVSCPYLLSCNTCCRHLCCFGLDTFIRIILVAVSWGGVMIRVLPIHSSARATWQ